MPNVYCLKQVDIKTLQHACLVISPVKLYEMISHGMVAFVKSHVMTQPIVCVHHKCFTVMYTLKAKILQTNPDW